MREQDVGRLWNPTHEVACSGLEDFVLAQGNIGEGITRSMEMSGKIVPMRHMLEFTTSVVVERPARPSSTSPARFRRTFLRLKEVLEPSN